MAFCMHCGSELKPGLAFCVMCGQPVEEETSQVEVSATIPMPQVKGSQKRCSNCGASLDSNDAFCQHCGASVSAQPIDKTPGVSAAHCSACGAQIQATDAFCQHCGAAVQGGAAVPQGLYAPGACSACGAPVSPDYAFCQHCGAAVQGVASAAASVDSVFKATPAQNYASGGYQVPPNPEKKSKTPLIAVIAALFFCAIVAAVVFFVVAPHFGGGSSGVDAVEQSGTAAQSNDSDSDQNTADEAAEAAQPAEEESSSLDDVLAEAGITVISGLPEYSYTVLLTRTTDLSDAIAFQDEISDAGLSSTVIITSDEYLGLYNVSETYYYVVCGNWDSESEADTAAQIFQNAGYSYARSGGLGEYVDGSEKVMLSAKTDDGETLIAIVHRDANGYVISDSSSTTYSKKELQALGLSDADLCIAWNEPFARLGYHFKNPDLQAYFESCSWYTDKNWSGSLSGSAATNNSRLREIASESSTAKKWMDLATS